MLTRVESISTIESEALDLARSTNVPSTFKPLKIDDARERWHAIELPASCEACASRPCLLLAAAWCCNTRGTDMSVFGVDCHRRAIRRRLRLRVHSLSGETGTPRLRQRRIGASTTTTCSLIANTRSPLRPVAMAPLCRLGMRRCVITALLTAHEARVASSSLSGLCTARRTSDVLMRGLAGRGRVTRHTSPRGCRNRDVVTQVGSTWGLMTTARSIEECRCVGVGGSVVLVVVAAVASHGSWHRRQRQQHC